MSTPRSALPAATVLLAIMALHAPSARAEVDTRARAWVSGVVSKIAGADARTGGPGAGSVTIRVRIEADGALADVGIDASSGTAVVDERAIRAVRAAAPFAPPPPKLLMLEGFTELSFPLQLGGKPAR